MGLAGGKRKKGRTPNPGLSGLVESVALVVNPGDPPKKKGKRKMATKRKGRRKASRSTRRSSSRKTTNRKRSHRKKAKKRRKNPASVSTRKAYGNKRAGRRNNPKTTRRKRRRTSNPSKLSMRGLMQILPSVGWTAAGWSLSGVITMLMGDKNVNKIAAWTWMKGRPGRAQAFISGVTWIGLWFLVDKVAYLKKESRRSNLLRGAGLRFIWDMINGFMPTDGWGKKVRTVFGLNQIKTIAPSAAAAAAAKRKAGTKPTGYTNVGYDPYDDYGDYGYDDYGYDDNGMLSGHGQHWMGSGIHAPHIPGNNNTLGFHYANWQPAQPSGHALMPGQVAQSATVNPLGFHYANWQPAEPIGQPVASGMAQSPYGAAEVNPLAGANPAAFKPAFR